MQLENEAEVFIELLKKFIERNAHATLNQEEYESKYNELANKYADVKRKVEEIEKRIFSQKIKFENIKEFIGRLEKQKELITEFDEELWQATIENIVINSEGEIQFIFKGRVK